MRRKLPRPRVIVPFGCLVALCLGATQVGQRQRAAANPWTVVVSKPIVHLGAKVGELYTEHEYLTAMMNQLDRDGLAPVFSRVDVHGDAERLFVFCQPK